MKITGLLKSLGINAGDVKSGDIVVRSPIDGSTIGRLKSDTPAQVRAKIGRAADAFREWREVPAPRRGELVRLLGEELRAHKDALGELVSVEVWGIVLSITSFGFIVGGVLVASRGLGANPVRTLLLVNIALWTITILFPIRSSIVPLAIGFFIFLTLIPVAEASEQTIIQKVVPFREQGRVFGFAQTVETAASPITAFLVGPIAQAWVIPFMSDGAGADTIGSWFGTGPDRGMALLFIAAGVIFSAA